MRQEFAIPGRLAALNEYIDACRANRYAGAGVKRENQEAVEWCIRQANLKPMARVDVRFTWVEANMRRDKDNIRFAAKFILDALVTQGVIRNDNWQCIGDLTDRFLVNRENPRIVVELEEI